MAQSRAQKDRELWHTWKADPNPETLTPLLESLQPLVQRRVGDFRAAPVPDGAVEAYANSLAIKAIETWNPEHVGGANLGTWTFTQLKKVKAFVAQYQNIGTIPEQRIRKITPFKEARDRLEARYGQPPSTHDLAAELNWSVKETARMQSELRSDLLTSLSLEPDRLGEEQEDHEWDVLRNIVHELTPQERSVYEYSLGINGKKKMTAGNIAKKLRISPAKVSRLRNSINKKLDRWGV